MSDRRTVDELTIEELEQILIVKRREARTERMQRLRELGRIPTDAALPNEDMAAIAMDALQPRSTLEPQIERTRAYHIEPLGSKRRRGKKNKKKRENKSRFGRVRDKALLVLEIGALVGLVAILVLSLSNLKSLNDDYAEAGPLPTPTPTPLLVASILPGGHAPPEEPGSVPTHLRSMVDGEAPPPVPIPTPGPEAPTRVVIPAIDVDALIVEGDSWEQLKLGVGHHLNTANPGERGNMVLSAHNDIYGEIFRHLDDLDMGDEVIVYANEQPYRYVITAKQIVEPIEVGVLAPTTKPVATLISCYPYMVDTHRIVLTAELQ
jgi:sortase A